MDSRSLGSSRSGKKRLPLPSAKQTAPEGDDLLSIISGDPEPATTVSTTDEIDLLSHFSSDSRKTRSKPRKPGSLLLGSTGPSGDYETKSAKSGSMKSNKSRKKLPLPSQMDSQDMLSSFMSGEPNSTSSVVKKEPRLAPKFGLDGNEQELLERLSNISSQSSKSKRNLPRPSNTLQHNNDDLLSYITNDTETRSNGYQDSEHQSENIVYEPVDSEEIDEEYADSPADDVKQAIDVLSLLSGQEGGIKPRVLTHRGKYSDEASSDVHSESSHERAESKVSGTGYISDRSASTKNGGSTVDSLHSSVQSGKQWNQNRAYFLRTAKMREKQKNSPLAKFLPGGALSSTERHHEKEAPESSVMENEMIEQLQLELEEARRTIRSHEGKIMQLQDEVDQARESCMEEECERVEAEIAKERVHNENRMLQIQLKEMESMTTPPPRNMSADFRPHSVEVNVGCMEVQTDESFLRGCKSAADVTSVNNKYEHRAIIEKHVRRRIGDEDDIREIMSDEEFTSDLDQAEGLLIKGGPIRSSTQNQIAIPFRVNTRIYKMNLLTQWYRGIVHGDFSCSLYKT